MFTEASPLKDPKDVFPWSPQSLMETESYSGHGPISHVCILRNLPVGESGTMKVLGECLSKTLPGIYLERFGVG